MSIVTKIVGYLQTFAAVILLGSVLSIGSANSADIGPPQGRVILTVNGDITVTNASDGAVFDYALFDGLPQTQLKTTTPWTDGNVIFEGVHAGMLMKTLGATGSKIVATALNDYSAELPVADFTEFNVIFATKLNGKRMRVRDKGPIWIIYPDTAGDSETIRHKMVWQVKSLTVVD